MAAKAQQVAQTSYVMLGAFLSLFDREPEKTEPTLKIIREELMEEMRAAGRDMRATYTDLSPQQDLLDKVRDENGNVSLDKLQNAGLVLLETSPLLSQTLYDALCNENISMFPVNYARDGQERVGFYIFEEEKDRAFGVAERLSKDQLDYSRNLRDMARIAEANRQEELEKVSGISEQMYEELQKRDMIPFIHGTERNSDGTMAILVTKQSLGELYNALQEASVILSPTSLEVANEAEKLKRDISSMYRREMVDTQKTVFVVDRDDPYTYVYSDKDGYHYVTNGDERTDGRGNTKVTERTARTAEQEIDAAIHGYKRPQIFVYDAADRDARVKFLQQQANILKENKKSLEKNPEQAADLETKIRYYKKHLSNEIREAAERLEAQLAHDANIVEHNKRILDNAIVEARAQGFDNSVQELREDRSALTGHIPGRSSVFTADLSDAKQYGGGQNQNREEFQEAMQTGITSNPVLRDKLEYKQLLIQTLFATHLIEDPQERREREDALEGNRYVDELSKDPEVAGPVMESVYESVQEMTQDQTYELEEVRTADYTQERDQEIEQELE